MLSYFCKISGSQDITMLINFGSKFDECLTYISSYATLSFRSVEETRTSILNFFDLEEEPQYRSLDKVNLADIKDAEAALLKIVELITLMKENQEPIFKLWVISENNYTKSMNEIMTEARKTQTGGLYKYEPVDAEKVGLRYRNQYLSKICEITNLLSALNPRLL